MNIILKFGKTIAKGLLTGLNEFKVSATPAVLKYLELLEKIAVRGIGGPLVLAVLAFLGYGITTTSVDILKYWEWTGKFWSWVALLLGKTEWLWMTALALAGIVSFVYVWLCGVLAAPIGIAIHAFSPATRNVPSVPVAVSWGGLAGSILTEIRDARIGITNALQVGVKEYVKQVKFVLTFIGLTYFFAAMFPSLRGVLFLLILGALIIIIAMREFDHPVASFIRFAICFALIWCMAGSMFPALNPFVSSFGTSPEKLTMGEVRATAKGTWDYINVFVPANWTKPAFWLFLIGIAPFVYIAYGTVLGWAKSASRKATAVAGTTDTHETTTSSHSGAHGGTKGVKLFDALTIGVLAVILMGGVMYLYKSWANWDTLRDIRIDAQAELHRIREEARRVTSPAVAVSQVPVSRPAPAVDMIGATLVATSKQGLKNPMGYVVQISTNTLSGGVPRPPAGMHLRYEPEELSHKIHVFVNGMKWDRVPGAQNIVPSNAKFFQYLGKDIPPTNMIVWVGEKEKTR